MAARTKPRKPFSGQYQSIGGILVKRCCRCEVTRELERFHVKSRSTDGLQPHCIPCDKARRAELKTQRSNP